MRSLFLKVFLWFWLATALVIAALFLTAELTRPRQQFPPFTGMDRVMGMFARGAATAYEREGGAGLVNFLGAHKPEDTDAFYLFDGRGAEVLGRPVPPEVLEAARESAASGRIIKRTSGGRMFVAHPAVTEGGGRYVLVDIVRWGPGGPFDRDFERQLPRVIAVLLTAGALCYALARYIVSPVIKLRAVTKQVADGNLSARVSPLLGRRRDELAAMGHDFDEMASRIETLVSAQTRLLRDISHELRSPLARLSVALDLARKRSGGAAAADHDRIEREARRLNEMIGQLLTLSRQEMEPDGGRREKVDLAALVRDVAEDADFEAKGGNRSVVITESDACEIEGSPALLRSAVENVVRNAVRHTPEGTSVKVSLRCSADGEGAHAVIEVRDEGPGVPEKALSEIFRPFFRADDSRTRETGGTGLGLAITERTARLHGGTVEAANVPGGGFVVRIRLPLGRKTDAGTRRR